MPSWGSKRPRTPSNHLRLLCGPLPRRLCLIANGKPRPGNSNDAKHCGPHDPSLGQWEDIRRSVPASERRPQHHAHDVPRCKKTLDKPDRVVPGSTGICPFRYKSTGAPPPWRTSNRTFIVGTPSETWLIVLDKYSLLSQHLADEIPVIICISPSRFLFENKADDRSGYSAGLVGSIFRGSPWYESFRVLSGVTSSVSTVRGATMDSNCFRVSALGYVHQELRRAGPNNLQRVESTHDDKPQRSWASALFRLSLVFCPPVG